MASGHPESNIAFPLPASVENRLDQLTRSAATTDTELALWLARNEIPALVEAVRSMLAEHRPDARGRCPVCRSRARRGWWPARRRGLCRAYVAARLALGDLR